MANLPTFFFSHARQDRETPGKLLTHFFEDLEIKLAQWAGISLREVRLGTIDARIRQSDDWNADLCRGLSENRAFVAILTPLYFNRINCGKELAVFLMRSNDLNIDQDGALTGARNVIAIRWLPEEAYAANSKKDALIPPILRRVEDTPADDGRDADRTQAIERYRKKGMESCVDREPDYRELLNLFAALIRDLQDLPHSNGADFTTARDAFKFDWNNYFAASGTSTASAAPARPVQAVVPRALSSVVAFYVTRRKFIPDPISVDFADQLIAESLSNTASTVDQSFAALLADVRAAGVAEGLSVFHAAGVPTVPNSSEQLLDRLKSLSDKGVLTVLVVDTDVWPGVAGAVENLVVEEIIRSPNWRGLVLLAPIQGSTTQLDNLAAARGLPSRLAVLPQNSEDLVSALRRAFVDARGRALSGSAENSPGAERVPLLKGVGGTRIQ